MVGASYLRELYLQKQLGNVKDFYHDSLLTNISNDMLNTMAVSIAVNDLFLRLRKFELDGDVYIKDRAYAFEKKLNINTNYIMDKRLGDYKIPEEEAQIPMMIFTPSIKNDGRRLFISPLPISYLTQTLPTENVSSEILFDGVEFSRMFEKQNAQNIKFTSVIRMNATFPYILPIASLPSEPKMEVMDAGLRDNFGMRTGIQFVYTFKDWLEKNTDGIVFLQVRDKSKINEVSDNPQKSILETFLSPVGSFYENLFFIQDYNHDQLVQYMGTWYNGKIDILDLQIKNKEKVHLSLSWHLTPDEKKTIIGAINQSDNQKTINKLKELLD